MRNLLRLAFYPGDNSSMANGLSTDGSTVVAVFYPSAFRWTRDSGMAGLGTFPGGYSGDATGAFADGSVVVGSANSATRINGEAYRWTAVGGSDER